MCHIIPNLEERRDAHRRPRADRAVGHAELLLQQHDLRARERARNARPACRVPCTAAVRRSGDSAARRQTPSARRAIIHRDNHLPEEHTRVPRCAVAVAPLVGGAAGDPPARDAAIPRDTTPPRPPRATSTSRMSDVVCACEMTYAPSAPGPSVATTSNVPSVSRTVGANPTRDMSRVRMSGRRPRSSSESHATRARSRRRCAEIDRRPGSGVRGGAPSR